jgi:predicted RNA-binding Zn ribbon-like protein
MDFVNTADIESGQDDLATEDGLRRWMQAGGLPGSDDPILAGDAARVRQAREAIRGVLAMNAGHRAEPGTLDLLGRAGGSAPVGLAVLGDGRLGLRPLGRGVDAALGALFGDIVTAVADGSWPRLKVCRADTCQAAYYDESRNHSRAWCSMAVCGNRQKGRKFRRRARGARAG